MTDTTPTFTVDYAGLSSLFTQLVTQFTPEIIVVAAAGFGVFAFQWGIPALRKLFKKTAS